MNIVTRFPPSPTGFLHIGSARTALFNYLYAKRHGGTFLLRIEDTDRERSTEAAVEAIFDGLRWLELFWDNKDVVFQFSRREEHAKIAHTMMEKGAAYKCYATPADLENMRAKQKAEGRPMRYDGRWRDRDASDAPKDVPFVVRLKAPQEGTTTVHDHVRGTVTVQNQQLDDMVLLRSDGTPTYMLSVVCDDHDMGVTHIIRGDDHFTNTFRQMQIYQAMGWPIPEFAHIPLINGPDGTKMSKRHGALGVDAYRDMGYSPKALRNYLLRLGWSHGDDEIISDEQAAAWFNLEHIVSSPARFDFVKLESLNAHYLRETDDGTLVKSIAPFLKNITGQALASHEAQLLEKAMPGLKQRAKTYKDLAQSAVFYILPRPLALNDGAKKILTPEAKKLLGNIKTALAELTDFSASGVEATLRNLAEQQGKKLGDVAQPLRAALSGSNVSPPVFEVAALLGKEEVLGRIEDAG